MPHDLRQYARQTNARLVIGGILLLLLVGGGLIYIFYGPYATISGLICLLVGLSPLFLIWFFLAVMELIVKHARQE
jgi:hypothetical protein